MEVNMIMSKGKNDKSVCINIICKECGDHHKVEVSFEDLVEKYLKGALVQEAFPYLTASERELIISDTCGMCYDKRYKQTTLFNMEVE